MDALNQLIPNFLFILLRAGIMVSFFPFLGSMTFPAKMKIGLAVAIAMVLAPVVEFKVATPEIPLVVMREVLFGIAMGLAARFVFYAVDMAGQLMGSSSGLSLGAVLNPEIGQSTEIAQFFGIVAMLTFLSLDAHHDLITLFVKSYEWIPAGQISIQSLIVPLVAMSGKMFVIALKISAPVIVLMLIANILLGFVYKAAPQVNVFFVAYPIYIFLGFTTMLLILPVFIAMMGAYFMGVKDDLLRIISAARG